jgi:DNA-binding response OmpR family regulator
MLLEASAPPDLVLLNVVLPKTGRWEITRTLWERSQTRPIPVIFINGNGTDSDEIVGLALGALDYLWKPVSEGRLSARIRAALRRGELKPAVVDNGIVRIEGLEIDIPRISVRVDGKRVLFRKKEFEVLAVLVNNRGSVLSRQLILGAVWSSRTEVYDRTVDVRVTKIRSKLGPYSLMIETLKRVGNRFRD